MRQKVVVTGGAGYIGGAVAFALYENGFEPIVIDNFSTSRPRFNFPFHVLRVNLHCPQEVTRCWQNLPEVFAVIHLAARAIVSESIANPKEYFENNFLAALYCIQSAVLNQVPLFIHSSTCSLYGDPQELPVSETCTPRPQTPYALSKYFVEELLMSYSKNFGIKILNLRYFNPAGAILSKNFSWGEQHEPETHLIPSIVLAALKKHPIRIFGNCYSTYDGTCVRDFIHIDDLARLHVEALHYLEATSNPVSVLNLGTGKSYSVQEVIEHCSSIVGEKLPSIIEKPRPGDPAKLCADISLMKSLLGYHPTLELSDMIRTQWDWMKSQSRSNY